jgi:hypothetical protein
MMMRKPIFVVAAVALTLAACAKTPFPVMETQLASLKGQPAQAVVKRLGEPNETSEIAGEKVYVWTSNDASLPAGEAIGFHCVVKVFVDKDDKVAHYDFDGNVGGCGYYAHRLDKSYRLLNWPAK